MLFSQEPSAIFVGQSCTVTARGIKRQMTKDNDARNNDSDVTDDASTTTTDTEELERQWEQDKQELRRFALYSLVPILFRLVGRKIAYFGFLFFIMFRVLMMDIVWHRVAAAFIQR